MLSLKNITKTYGNQQVLRDVQCTIERGCCVGVIGPNGSGKSTLLRIASGLEPPDRGIVLLEGMDIRHVHAKTIAKMMAVVTQDPLPLSQFTVRDIVAMGRYPFETWRGRESCTIIDDSLFGSCSRKTLIARVIDFVGLSDVADVPIAQLSGGQRQRVALAKAIAQQPRLLLLDEPTAHLDMGAQIRWMLFLRQWMQSSDLTVFIVLHDVNLAALYCDRLLLFHEGTLLAHGTPQDVLTHTHMRILYEHAPIFSIPHPQRRDVPQWLFPARQPSHIEQHELKEVF